MNYRADIDGLRAIAVLLVLVFHFDLLWEGKAGFIGVDIFYVISGFLITAIVKKQLDEGDFELKKFYLNRIRRLAPALFFTLILVFVAGLFLLFPADLLELSKQILFSQAYLANFFYWKNINYFGLHADNVFLLHTWSLAVEEQFYLIYPFVLLLANKYFKRYFWAVLAIGFVVSFLLNILFVKDRPEAVFYLLPTRAWELLAGGLAYLPASRISVSHRLGDFFGVLGILLIAVAVAVFDEQLRVPGYFALMPTFGAVFLLLAGSGQPNQTSRLLGFQPFAYIGKISYPLYLVHWPVNVFANLILADDYSIVWRSSMFLLSVLIAMFVYHAVENPIRHRVIVASDQRLIWAYFSGIVVTVILYSLTQFTGGFPKRYDDKVIELVSHVADKTQALRDCEFSGQSSLSKKDFCLVGMKGRRPEWLIYGDSHAWAAFGVFEKWLQLNGQSGLFIFRNSCPPINGVHLFHDNGKCFAFNRAVNEFLRSSEELKNVLLVSTWRQPIEARISTSADVKLDVKRSISLFEQHFSATVREQNSLGVKVYVWEPVPGAKRNVPIAMAKAALSGVDLENIEITQAEYFSTFQFFFEAIEKNKIFITSTFSPSDALCANGRCAIESGGVPLYFDNNHITRSSMDFWVRMMNAKAVVGNK